jgi:hypothetical protein
MGINTMNKNKTSSHKIGRDARTGEFIPVKEAKRRPSTTVVETIKRTTPRSPEVKFSSHKIGRDSRTGAFVTLKEAQRRPSTTVVNTFINDSQKSLAFLQNAGILTATGRLSIKYKK